MIIANENYFRFKIRVCDNYQAEICLITLRFIHFDKEEVSECRHPIYKLLTRFFKDKIWNEMHHTLQRFEGFYQNILSDIYHFLTSYRQSLKRGLLSYFNHYFCRMIFTYSLHIINVDYFDKKMLNIPNAWTTNDGKNCTEFMFSYCSMNLFNNTIFVIY